MIVDDFLFCGSSPVVLDTITHHLSNRFGDIKLENGPKLQYLNMVIDASIPDKLTFDMSRYKHNMVDNLVLPTRKESECCTTNPTLPYLILRQ